MADTYNILSQKQTSTINPAGTGFMEVWEITYKVTSGPANGTVATVQVPDDEHDAAHVKDAIETKIQALNAVAQLGSPGSA